MPTCKPSTSTGLLWEQVWRGSPWAQFTRKSSRGKVQSRIIKEVKNQNKKNSLAGRKAEVLVVSKFWSLHRLLWGRGVLGIHIDIVHQSKGHSEGQWLQEREWGGRGVRLIYFHLLHQSQHLRQTSFGNNGPGGRIRERKEGRKEVGNLRQEVMAEGNKIGNGMNSNTWNRLPGEGLASKGMTQEAGSLEQLPDGKLNGQGLWWPHSHGWASESPSSLDPLPAFTPWKALKDLLSMAQKTSILSFGRKIIMPWVQKTKTFFSFFHRHMHHPSWDLDTLATKRENSCTPPGLYQQKLWFTGSPWKLRLSNTLSIEERPTPWPQPQ